jgi:rhodanese-related sulfurtransferase
MVKSIEELLAAAREQIPELEPGDVRKLLDEAGEGGHPVHIIDVRDGEELIMGTVPGSHHASRGTLEMQIGAIAPDIHAKIVLYCAGGVRSLFAGKQLLELGYENVFSMAGGYRAWAESGLPAGQAS